MDINNYDMEYRITVSFVSRTGNACAEDNSSKKRLICCFSNWIFSWGVSTIKPWYFETLSICFEGNRHMFLLSAFVPASTSLQKDLLRFNHPLSICSQFKSVTGNYGKLNLIGTLNSVFRVNANKLKAMAFTLHGRERKQNI